MARLRRGDLPPRILNPPPGPLSRRLARSAARHEAPGINTVTADGTTLFWQEARGANILDVDGNRFVDLTSGFGAAAVGHRHPDVVTAVRRQAGILLHGLGDVHSHPDRPRLARQLLRLAPVDDGQVYFAVSGSDAIEIALKTALLATGREEIVAFDPAYHGLSLGALQVTSRPEFRRPFEPHFHRRVRRLSFGCPVTTVEAALRRHKEVGCVVIEPVIGREGILLPPEGWVGDLREVCHRHDVLLIVDEILTGLGRTGRWFAVEHEGVRPDLLCCGKSLGGGLPIAAVLGRRDLLGVWQHDGEALHTGTFVAQPLACAAALATLEVMRSERLPRRAASLGRTTEAKMTTWPIRFPGVTATRGRGLMWGVEMRTAAAAHELSRSLMQQGVLALAGGPEGRVLQLLPPLVIRDSLWSASLEIIESLLGRQ